MYGFLIGHDSINLTPTNKHIMHNTIDVTCAMSFPGIV